MVNTVTAATNVEKLHQNGVAPQAFSFVASIYNCCRRSKQTSAIAYICMGPRLSPTIDGYIVNVIVSLATILYNTDAITACCLKDLGKEHDSGSAATLSHERDKGNPLNPNR